MSFPSRKNLEVQASISGQDWPEPTLFFPKLVNLLINCLVYANSWEGPWASGGNTQISFPVSWSLLTFLWEETRGDNCNGGEKRVLTEDMYHRLWRKRQHLGQNCKWKRARWAEILEMHILDKQRRRWEAWFGQKLGRAKAVDGLEDHDKDSEFHSKCFLWACAPHQMKRKLPLGGE